MCVLCVCAIYDTYAYGTEFDGEKETEWVGERGITGGDGQMPPSQLFWIPLNLFKTTPVVLTVYIFWIVNVSLH